MPLFEIGYRTYEGVRTSPRLRWWPIARTGVVIAWRSKLLRRLVYAAYLPLLYLVPFFFAIGKLTDPDTDLTSGPWTRLVDLALPSALVERLIKDPATVRCAIWATVFSGLTVWIQLWLAGMVAAIAGPPLISQDLRSKAFLLYFSRPISRVDYLLGKAGTLAGLLATVTLLPSLLLYALSIVFSPSLGTLLDTLPVLGNILLSSLVTIVPVTLIVLLLSSLTKQARFATVAWAVLCAFGVLFHVILQATRQLADETWPRLFSLPETVRVVQLSIFDLRGRFDQALDPAVARMIREFTPDSGARQATIFLGLLSLVCLLVLLRRVGAPTRI